MKKNFPGAKIGFLKKSDVVLEGERSGIALLSAHACSLPSSIVVEAPDVEAGRRVGADRADHCEGVVVDVAATLVGEKKVSML